MNNEKKASWSASFSINGLSMSFHLPIYFLSRIFVSSWLDIFSFFSISISSSVFFPFFLCFSRWSVPIKWLTKNLQFFYLFISPLTSSIFLFSLFPLFLTSFEKYFCNSWNSYLFVLLCSSTFPSSLPMAKNKKRAKESIYLPHTIHVCVYVYLSTYSFSYSFPPFCLLNKQSILAKPVTAGKRATFAFAHDTKDCAVHWSGDVLLTSRQRSL